MKSPIIHKIQSLIKTINLNYLIILNNLSILNINLFIFLVFIVYYFVCGLNFYGLIVFSVSLIISLYVFYHYTYKQIFKSFLIFSILFIISLFFISSLIVKFKLISLDDINKSHLISEDANTKTNLPTLQRIDEAADSTDEGELKRRIIDEMSKLLNDANDSKEFVERILEMFDNGGSNNSIHFAPWDSLTNIYSEVYQVIDSLSQTQKGALIHISFSVVILFCLFTLIGVYYGEKFIQYFKLESKFPRLARYIDIRRKFQQFYFILNSLFIIFILLFIILFNVFIFIYSP